MKITVQDDDKWLAVKDRAAYYGPDYDTINEKTPNKTLITDLTKEALRLELEKYLDRGYEIQRVPA